MVALRRGRKLRKAESCVARHEPLGSSAPGKFNDRTAIDIPPARSSTRPALVAPNGSDRASLRCGRSSSPRRGSRRRRTGTSTRARSVVEPLEQPGTAAPATGDRRGRSRRTANGAPGSRRAPRLIRWGQLSTAPRSRIAVAPIDVLPPELPLRQRLRVGVVEAVVLQVLLVGVLAHHPAHYLPGLPQRGADPGQHRSTAHEPAPTFCDSASSRWIRRSSAVGIKPDGAHSLDSS